LGTLRHRQLMPVRRRQAGRHAFHALRTGCPVHQARLRWLAAASAPGWHSHLGRLAKGIRVAGHFQHVAPTFGIQGVPQTGHRSVARVRRDPLPRQMPGLTRPAQQAQAQLGLCLIADLIRHTGLATALPVARPRLGQIQRLVHQGMSSLRDVGQKHAHLAVGDLSQRAAILPSHPNRLLALFGEAGLIQNPHAVPVAQPRTDIPLQAVDHRLGRPRCLRQEPLQSARRCTGNHLRQILGVATVGLLLAE